ncbi:MAG: sigma-70 family RNA polymerase sigma factor [Pirellulales bacterium]
MSDVTRILSQMEAGDPTASERLLPLVYAELRKLAARQLQNEPANLTIQPTALVHEAYLRLVDVSEPPRWDSRGHFFAAAAQAMRRILVDNARRRQSLKKGGAMKRVEVNLNDVEGTSRTVDLVALDEALSRLTELDPRKTKLVELRYFSGLTMDQAASVLGISVATAQRDWCFARAWLFRELSDETPAAE